MCLCRSINEMCGIVILAMSYDWERYNVTRTVIVPAYHPPASPEQLKPLLPTAPPPAHNIPRLLLVHPSEYFPSLANRACRIIIDTALPIPTTKPCSVCQPRHHNTTQHTKPQMSPPIPIDGSAGSGGYGAYREQCSVGVVGIDKGAKLQY